MRVGATSYYRAAVNRIFPARVAAVLSPIVAIDLKNISPALKLGPFTYGGLSAKLEEIGKHDDMARIIRCCHLGTVDRFLTITPAQMEEIYDRNPGGPRFSPWEAIRTNFAFAVFRQVKDEVKMPTEKLAPIVSLFWDLRKAEAKTRLEIPLLPDESAKLSAKLAKFGYRIQ